MSARAVAIRTLFPGSVVVEDALPSATDARLFPEEEAVIARAIEKRRREFTAGRACVRRAFAKLGVPAVAVPNDERRAPVWPDGVVGSISHTGDYCAVVVARRADVSAVGLDVEKDEGVAERLWERICTEEELAFVRARDAIERGWWVRLLFSAKESFYKCQYLVTEKYLGFHDVTVSLDPDARRFEVTLDVDAGAIPRGETLGGGWIVTEGVIATGCFRR